MGADLLAVTGATGFVGQAVLDLAQRRGLEVRALARRPQEPRAGVEWVQGDLADKAALRRLFGRATVVVHIAGVVNAPDAAGFEAGNVTGTMNVIETALRVGVPRLVHVSSLSAREPQLSLYGASKLKGERLVKAAPLDWTVVRPPAVYGPRDTEMLELFRLARKGFMPLPPEGRLSIIHVNDLARLLLALLPPGEDVTGRVFEPDDGQPGGWTHHSLAKAIGVAVGRRVTPMSLPPGLLRFGARADRFFRKDKAKLTEDRVGYMCHPDWLAGESNQPPEALWRAKVETRMGLHATAAWYREAGWL
ncbi:NAD-dependent epimerase/dehydratase family protein [Novosphingobium olei]|uniref:NAD-dependent epimerase/dehydratase family protein n=1 Tax=Novosphingobium olei TaxID=2728851 RepID=A0A7Y0BLG6_9SPHN|nr:NAD-dependent epimerase/dehydratase family protein [Novosphingobium olei]NML92519.1 NAD-dependent epimerase/dehydratase family protein [Novosphingobium olei]BEV01624.1 NAD-dependent epimerase/dehydratase family protein [Novosphingobium olei]